MSIPASATSDLASLDMSLDEGVLGQLGRYLDLLLDENTRINLTAVRQRDLAWHRLILDSLTVLGGLDMLDAGSRVIDVGSGGGIPGIPLAIVRPNYHFTLLDATGKKVRFLQHVIDSLELTNVTAIQDRAETLGQALAHRQQYDAALSRAVGAIAEVLEYTLPLLRVGGRTLLLKGKEAQQQLEKAGDALAVLGAGDVSVFDAYPPDAGDPSLVIISILKDHLTPDDFPRLPGTAKNAPL